MLKKFLEKHEIKRIHVIITFAILIILFFVIKLFINYVNYNFEMSFPIKTDGISSDCVDFVVNKKPTIDEYKKSIYKNNLYRIQYNAYLTCFENLRYVDYPKYYKKIWINPITYSIEESLDNELLNNYDLNLFVNDFLKNMNNEITIQNLIIMSNY